MIDACDEGNPYLVVIHRQRTWLCPAVKIQSF
jgi:hypothetical protein